MKDNNHNEKYQYKKIEEYIMEGIYSGRFPANSLLPTEKELCEMFNVSRMTANKSLKKLANDGLVERIRGSGSFVRLPNLEKQSVIMSSFTEQYSKRGIRVSSKLISCAVMKANDFPKLKLAEKLCIKGSDNIHFFVRLRYGDGEPLAIQYTYVPVSRVSAIDINYLSSSFYEYLEKKLNLSLGNGQSHMCVILPNEEIKKHLEIPDNDPVVHTAHISCFRNGLPFEYVDTYCVYHRYALDFTNKRDY